MSIKNWQINNEWTLFLDRDGVINERIFGGYITNPDEFKFKPGVLEAISGLSEIFKYIFVVTNQQGIGKGLMSERNLLEIHQYMCDEIREVGGRIDACFFASNIKGAENDRRKPDPFMANEARRHFPDVDFSKSVMLGDTDSDILFGRNLGMMTVLIESDEIIQQKPDLKVGSLTEFEKIVRDERNA